MAGKDDVVYATQEGLDEVAKRIEEALDELKALTARVETVTGIATAASDGVAKVADTVSRKSADGGYDAILEDKVAVLEWSLENQQGVDLAQARKAVLRPVDDPADLGATTG